MTAYQPKTIRLSATQDGCTFKMHEALGFALWANPALYDGQARIDKYLSWAISWASR